MYLACSVLKQVSLLLEWFRQKLVSSIEVDK
jgi:hypothetical protein